MTGKVPDRRTVVQTMPPFDWQPEQRQLARLGLPTALLFALRTAQLLTDQAVMEGEGGCLSSKPGATNGDCTQALKVSLEWFNP